MTEDAHPLNWIRTINALYNYSAAHPITPRAAVMYHYMLYTFSRARWPEWAEIGLGALAAGCNMSGTAVKQARAELVSLHIIDYLPQGANRHARYRLREPHLWFSDVDTDEIMQAREAITGSRASVGSVMRDAVYDIAASRGG